MFDPNNEENNHEEEEEFEDANESNEEEDVWNDKDLSDFDYLKGIMQSEYGNNEFLNSGRITDEGDYDFDVGRDDPDRENYRRRANYILLSRILPDFEGSDFVVPSYDVMEGHGIIQSIKPRFSPKTNNFNGFEYRKDPFKPFKKIIVRDKSGGLRYTGDKTPKPILDDFREELNVARNVYEELATRIIDAEMKWDDFFEGIKLDRSTAEGWVKAKKTKDEIRAEIKKGYLSQLEENMRTNFPKLLKEFDDLGVSSEIGGPYS